MGIQNCLGKLVPQSVLWGTYDISKKAMMRYEVKDARIEDGSMIWQQLFRKGTEGLAD